VLQSQKTDRVFSVYPR